ncbi:MULTISPECIES: N-acetyltransferase [unclassified Clostridium]|uniref:GNAT family N-acetyltransferase n=1 Tax=unclassified Clostridium TaxID=2614128 RepID=UPI0002985F3C|nr:MULTISPECIES: N-acetyltransferase [unclassified Clostridium]EKQ54721.1 MAG: putative acetyltransferase [Clostridium sp. Maddingley MBC34-26]
MVEIENIKLRLEKPEDYKAVENLTREAFWNVYVPGCSEHYLIHNIRNSDAFIKQLDIVAEIDDRIVGNIVYTNAKILGDDGNSYNVVCFGPISILPEFQGRGIGGMLIRHTKNLAQKLGYRAILIYGDPEYYSRYGFAPAETYGIGTADNMYAVPLQACELYSGALKNCKGRFYEDKVYEIDEAKAAEFDKCFPKKDKQSKLPSQERFNKLVAMRKPRN